MLHTLARRLALLALTYAAWRALRPAQTRAPDPIGRRTYDADPDADTFALALVTKLYARYGTDEQLHQLYGIWHTGHHRSAGYRSAVDERAPNIRAKLRDAMLDAGVADEHIDGLLDLAAEHGRAAREGESAA